MSETPNSRALPPSAGRLENVPIGLQILVWFFLNLLLVCLIGSAVFLSKFGSGLDMLVDGKAGERVDALRIKVFRGLNFQPLRSWNETLKVFAKKYRIEIAIFLSNGERIAGEIKPPPALIAEEMLRLPAQWTIPPSPENLHPRNAQNRLTGLNPSASPLFFTFPGNQLFSGAPRPFIKKVGSTYWLGVRLPPITPSDTLIKDIPVLLLASDSIQFGGLLIEVTPLVLSILVLIGSALFWLPLVRRITRPILAMEKAAHALASGNFKARVNVERGDELGRLAHSINTLAEHFRERLESRRRFVGDIAHELGSPLARMQWALDILQKQATEQQKPALHDLREEVDNMVNLTQELLNFNKSVSSTRYTHEPVCIASLVHEAAKQESIPSATLDMQALDPIKVEANAHLLKRAISNILRNCLRYAPDAGPIRIYSVKSALHATLHITDGGPGVPPEMIPRLGEPFFRTDSHRSRETGGTGLGLSIVKRCVEACNGTLQIANAVPQGLTVSITLKIA
jgi:two-component system sensor histidine kinase CpxA